MKNRLIWMLLLISVTSVTAQYLPSQVWHEGELTLLDGDRLRGKIMYNLESDLIQLNLDNTVQTYSARKILFFEIYDQEYARYRQFYALPYAVNNSNYETPHLFEVLHENTLTLLCREEITQESIPQFGYYRNFGRMNTRPRLTFDYFFLDQDGKIVRYSQKKDDLYDILDHHTDELQRYMKENRLKHDRQGDLVRITAYYNSLISS